MVFENTEFTENQIEALLYSKTTLGDIFKDWKSSKPIIAHSSQSYQ